MIATQMRKNGEPLEFRVAEERNLSQKIASIIRITIRLDISLINIWLLMTTTIKLINKMRNARAQGYNRIRQ